MIAEQHKKQEKIFCFWERNDRFYLVNLSESATDQRNYPASGLHILPLSAVHQNDYVLIHYTDLYVTDKKDGQWIETWIELEVSMEWNEWNGMKESRMVWGGTWWDEMELYRVRCWIGWIDQGR